MIAAILDTAGTVHPETGKAIAGTVIAVKPKPVVGLTAPVKAVAPPVATVKPVPAVSKVGIQHKTLATPVKTTTSATVISSGTSAATATSELSPTFLVTAFVAILSLILLTKLK
jgi:hypothetical protein